MDEAQLKASGSRISEVKKKLKRKATFESHLNRGVAGLERGTQAAGVAIDHLHDDMRAIVEHHLAAP
ncbi:MAG: hypothetical protein R3F44_17185 [Candidatus Competibacteraceae bacterium]